MPSSLSFRSYLAAIETAGSRLAVLAEAAGEDSEVPTCPAWNVRALVAHQTMVHRWATAHVTGTDPAALPSQTEIRETIDDLYGYYTEGLLRLLEVLDAAPADLEAMTFLNDAPAPRAFWARRQAHETAVHMVDALAATLGRVPTTDEAEIDRDLALDGIDELLAGFFTRGRSKLFDGETYTMLVCPDDSQRRWHIQVDEKKLTVSAESTRSPRLSMSGAAATIYLGLWNRGDQVTLTGDASVMDRWHTVQKVRWR